MHRFFKSRDLSLLSHKEIGNYGEEVAALYLKRHGMKIIDRNVAKKTGEIDVIAKDGDGLHFVEVKTNLVERFPTLGDTDDEYDPSLNLHPAKIRKIARTAAWYTAEKEWDGEWQVDGCLVWLRRADGAAFVKYLPQIV